jgi:hypothetical protein
MCLNYVICTYSTSSLAQTLCSLDSSHLKPPPTRASSFHESHIFFLLIIAAHFHQTKLQRIADPHRYTNAHTRHESPHPQHLTYPTPSSTRSRTPPIPHTVLHTLPHPANTPHPCKYDCTYPRHSQTLTDIQTHTIKQPPNTCHLPPFGVSGRTARRTQPAPRPA